MWVLRSAEPDGDPWVFRLSPGAIRTIGRTTSVDFIMDAALVSRIHCRLEADDEGVNVVDLESTNGTFVNDARVQRARLTDGDRLRVGRVQLTIARSA